MSKASKGKAGEKKVASILGKIDGAYCVFNDVTLLNANSEMTHQVDHILIHPHGLFVIETKNYAGTINVDELGRWSKTHRGRTVPIHNPLRQNKSHAITLRKGLKSQYKPIPVVVFVANNAPYLPDENAINLSDLPLFIESYPYPKLYSPAELEDMKRAVASLSADVSLKEHLANIRVMKQVKKELEEEMAYAIEKGLCPRCDAKLIIEGYSYHCPHCGYRFDL